MRKLLTFIAVCALASATYASELNRGKHDTKDATPSKFARTSNLIDHGGPVLVAPKVVCIFWGWASGDSYTAAMQDFRNRGIQPYIAMLAQYRSAGTSAPSDMGGSANDKFDSSQPPQAVSDAAVQGEVAKFFGGVEDPNTVYEVFIPATSYSSDGSGTSCGGPNLRYCAYHSHFADGSHDVKYSIEPFPSCSGCQSSGFSDAQNANHFMIHETRETISDEDLNAWYDSRGAEADDKCAWSPNPFIDQSTGFAYQYEWSNAAHGCVQK